MKNSQGISEVHRFIFDGHLIDRGMVQDAIRLLQQVVPGDGERFSTGVDAM